MKPTCHYDRRAFLRHLLIGALATRTGPAWAQDSGSNGALVQWARLRTSRPAWQQHRDQDVRIVEFIRNQARVPLDPRPRTVTAASVQALSQFPLIFSNNVAAVTDPHHVANVGEYLRRGGFFYVDGCVDWQVTPDFVAYFKEQVAFFGTVAPGAQVRLLDESSSIFRSFFKLSEAETRTGRSVRGHWDQLAEGLYGVFQDERMISLLSLDHLCCGWLQDQDRARACLKEIANIYVFSMTR